MLSFPMFSSRHLFPSVASLVAPYRKASRPIISPASPLESTLPIPLASVHPKPLTATRFPLESTLTKKTGGSGQLLLTSKTREARAAVRVGFPPTRRQKNSRLERRRQSSIGCNSPYKGVPRMVLPCE